MAINKHIDIPFTVTGGVSTGGNGGINTLSGYTNKLTTFNFKISSESPHYSNPPWLSNDVFVWDLGDGSRVKGVSAVHTYNYPGIYTISLVAYSSAGQEYLSTETKELSVGNFFNDKLELTTDDVINVVNVPAGSTTNRIKLTRTNSWQPHNAVSATGYTINLHASGSSSKQLNLKDYETFKWAHLDKTWSFFKPITANDNTITHTPVQSLSTIENEDIYYVKLVGNESQYYQRVTGDYLTSLSAKDTVFVGTTGAAEFLYVDNIPKFDDSVVFAFAHIDTSDFPQYTQSLYGNFESFSPLRYFQSFGVTIPIRVKFNPAVDIQFTSSGIRSMALSKLKYQLIETPFFINFGDSYNNLTLNYPTLNANPAVTPGASVSTDLYTVSLSTVSGLDTGFSKVSLLSTHYFKQSDTQVSQSLSGTFRGLFVPIDTANNVKLIGSVNVNDVPNYPKDINFAYVTNSDHAQEIRILYRDNFVTNNSTGIIENSKDVKLVTTTTVNGYQTNTADITTPIAVVHESDSLSNNKVIAYLGNSSSGTLSSIDTYNQIKSRIPHVNVQIQDDPLEEVINIESQYYTGTAPSPSLSATSISIDNERNIYIAVPGVSLVQKLSAESGNLIHVYQPAKNITYTSVNSGTANNRLSVKYGIDATYDPSGVNSTHSPSIVETGKNGHVWIGYTNPVSGVIEQYTTPDNMSAKYEFDQPLVPTDLIVDNNDNLWVSVKNPLRQAHGYKNEPDDLGSYSTTNDFENSLSALGVTGIAYTSAGNTFNYVFTTTSFGISANDILEVTGFEGATNTKWYNGDFLVDSVSANNTKTAVNVTPYIGIYNQATSNTGNTTVSAFKRPSDRLYKFDQAGTKLFCVSGFLNPEHIIVDNNQQLWISHKHDTLTQVNTAGDKLQSIVVRDDTFVSDNLGSGSDLVTTELWPTLGGAVFSPLTGNEHHIGGISFDTYNNLLVLNGFENRIYTIPSLVPTLSTGYALNNDQSPISARHGFIHGRMNAKGDWTGYRWLNKYKNTTGVREITGETTFGVYSSAGQYSITKVNENFDPEDTIKDYAFTPELLDNDVLFTDFIGSIVGNLSAHPSSLGRTVYEKIANFVDNHNDPDTCSIKALYSLCEMYGVDINDYNLTYPGRLKRIADLISISQRKLWGFEEKADNDFNVHRPGAVYNPLNLGDELTVTSYVVSADQPLIAKYIFDGQSVKVVTGYVSPFADSGWGSRTSPHYVTKYDVLSSYPLSAINPYWGWGLTPGVTGTDISRTIKFYEHKHSYSNTILDGVIDWINPQTTISREVSSIDDWSGDDKIVDNLIDFELRSGLQLFSTQLSAYTPGVL